MGENCYCGYVSSLRTAWTEHNAGRRFMSCVNGVRGCNYFRWIDPPLSNRAGVVICGLLRRIKANERELEELRLFHMEELKNARVRSVKNKWVKSIVFVVLIVIMYVLLC